MLSTMTPELTLLVWSVILTFVLIMIPASMGIKENGGPAQAGPRDDLPESSVLRKRATRLAVNMKENLLLFAALVLIANAAGVSNDMTVLGAQLFFYARVVHAVVYLAGWPHVRPLVWLVSLVGMGMIAAQIL